MLCRSLTTLQEFEEKGQEEQREKEIREAEVVRLTALPTSSDNLGLDPAFFEACPPEHEMWVVQPLDQIFDLVSVV